MQSEERSSIVKLVVATRFVELSLSCHRYILMNDFFKQIAALSPEQRMIFEKRLKQKRQNKVRTQEIHKIEIPKRKNSTEIPLSFAQQRLWFFQQLNPVNSAYNIFGALRLEGQLNIALLEKVFTEIARRHESLRTTFATNSQGVPIQVITPSQPFKILIEDLQDVPNRDKELQRLAIKEAQKPFDLTKPLLRITLLKLAETDNGLLLTMHHIISDRWSLGIFVREMKLLYEAFSNEQSISYINAEQTPLPELPIQYADWAVWQQQYLQEKLLQVQTNYWKKQLANLPIIKLPTDRPRPATATYKGAKQIFELSKTLSDALKSLNVKEGVTLFTLLLTVFKVLLYKYTDRDDVVVGTDIANRSRVETEGLIGFLINTLVLRTDLSGNPNFIRLLNQVREVTIKAYEHQDLPFDKLVEILKPERNLSEMVPLFQVKFDLQLAQVEPVELSNLTINPFDLDNSTTKFELRFNISQSDRGLTGLVEYSTDIFDTNTITRMVEHYRNLLEQVVANPQQRLSELSLLTETERCRLLDEWNDTEAYYPQDKCIHELFEARVEKTHDAAAVVFEDEQLTYRELNVKANQLAHYLQQLGVKPEVRVGICVERSLEMVIGMLAILKAGGAYVPLDPNYPKERLKYILDDSQASVLLTQAALAEEIPPNQAQVVYLDTDWHPIAQQNQENLSSQVTPDNLAYIIYTSGSTGQPKGVQIPHLALSNFLCSMRATPGLSSEDILLAVTTYSFDIAALEIFLPIIVGARLVVASQEIISDGIQLSALLTDSQATVMQATPATWQLLLASGWNGNNQLKVLCGGEALPPQLANQLLDRCDSLWNMYGPTETTIWSATSEIKSDSKIIPIGRPIANTQLYILDRYSQLVPVGVAGELCIGGKGLARGYFHRSDITAEKFVPNPFDSERLYKTGDLARYLPNGEIEYIGRIDNQVKVRGFRIELGEIEAQITQYPAVRESVVVVRDDIPGDKRLVAYVVAQEESMLTISALREFLASKLPSYMIPSTLVNLETLPLTPNGKVNRKALPSPELTQVSSSNIVPASTPIENLLAGIWAEILGIEKVGIDNNFFELGGHSLIATRVISQIRQVFKVELQLRSLFEKPTIAGLAQEIEKAIKSDSGISTTTIEKVSRTEKLPLSFAQQRLWFLSQLEPDSPLYNIPAAVRLRGKLNLEALKQSFNQIITRHETLRTNFQTQGGETLAVISPVDFFTIPLLDLSCLPTSEKPTQIQQQIEIEARQPFDISSEQLIRIKLLRLGEEEHIVLLTMHHIISDGWSVGVLVKEIATLYQAFCQGQPSPLAELPIQYVDFAAWQRQCLQGEVLETQQAYWLKQLENAPKVLELPTDRPRPAVQTFRGANYSFKLSPELSAALNQLSQHQGSTLFMTLLAGFQTLLWCYTGQEDIVVGSPIANRNRAEIEGLIGFFVNTLVMRTSLEGNPSFEKLLKRVRETALGAYAHLDLPFELLVEQLQPERDLSYTPLFQVMFVLQNAPMSALELPGLTLTPIETEGETAKFDLTLYMTETESGLDAKFEYNTDLFESATIARMARHLQTLLEGIVANPQQQLSDLPLLTESEQHQLLVEWNDTQVDQRSEQAPSCLGARSLASYADAGSHRFYGGVISDYPQDKCIHELFEARVEKTHDAAAVVFEDEQLTYRELNVKANQLAHYLQQLGVKPEVRVGICVERSLEMVIGMLAILKAGGAYVPLDPNYPKERLKYILDDSQASVLLTQAALAEEIPPNQAQVVYLDTDWHPIAQQNQENLSSQVTPDNLAYIIYTSGSTGQPKGVQIPHLALSNFLCSMRATPGLSSEDILLAVTTYSFDIAALEIFLPIIVGARLVVASQEIISDGIQLSALLTDSQATVMQATPATWQLLLASGWNGNNQLKVLCGGEALPPQLANQLLDRCDSLWNMYGPTETTIWSATSEIKSDSKIIPIGRPIANTQLYILDQYSQLVPVGVAGELCIGGKGLARGYFHRSDITAEKFVPNPFDSERLYKTGDLARYLPNGEIEYIGRIDNQVKVRGFRIELGEIEAAITQHSAVQETVVIARDDIPGDKRLVAYVVSEPESTLTISALREFLDSKLPSYMIPSALVNLETLPLTPNGKIDRKALPAPSTRSELDKKLTAPRNFIERKLAEIWTEILGVDKVGIFDNFFELGGDSILATVAVTRANQAGELKLTVKQLFQHQTVADLATVAVTRKIDRTEPRVIKRDTPANFSKAKLNQKDLERFLAKVKSGSKNKTI